MAYIKFLFILFCLVQCEVLAKIGIFNAVSSWIDSENNCSRQYEA